MYILNLWIFKVFLKKISGPYRHDNEIVPTSSTLIVDSTDLSRPVVNFDPEDSLYGKKFKANGDDLGKK